MQRRQFFTLSGSVLGGVLLSQCARSRPAPSPSVNAVSVKSLNSPPVFTSQNGRLAVDLSAEPGRLNTGNQALTIWGYNGQSPGPRLEVQPGDRVQLTFTNRLPAPTNLHFHGLHIPPTGAADNVFRHIEPGDTFTYEFEIPADHPATLAYYHPHLHGHVAQQIFAGLGGLIVVRGDLDEVLRDSGADLPEEFLFLKDFDPAGVENADRFAQPRHGVQMIGREGAIDTVNGDVQPNIAIAPQGWLRLRIVNAATSKFYNLRLEDHPFTLIATDGGSLAQPQPLDRLLLAPGERADVLIQGDRDRSTYALINEPYQRTAGGMGMGMMGRGMMGRRSQSSQTATTLATLTYTDTSPTPFTLPASLIPVDPLPQPSQTREFRLHHGMNPGHGMAFLINGQAFQGDTVHTTVTVGTTEDWLIQNIDIMDHPFHIHTNRFQVIERNGQPLNPPAWKDTVLVAAGETVRIRIPFRTYKGRTVYHCHILDHEELGMMGVIEMV
ncbi:multicopper oxidase family protein [Spirulina major]|uniref:multicopper oxidase family protein n=1 Tax=Spirulina major TaxID=270636 RepID=UPI000933C99D|nr:multicopper oxidase family protein [Spirulina major]